MDTCMQIKYENTTMPAMQLLNQSQFIIIIQNWELGYCPDKRQEYLEEQLQAAQNPTVLSHMSPKDWYPLRAADGDGEGQEEC